MRWLSCLAGAARAAARQNGRLRLGPFGYVQAECGSLGHVLELVCHVEVERMQLGQRYRTATNHC
jgi:hypothetical protein